MAIMLWAVAVCMDAQELNVKININHSQIQGTETAIFEELQTKLQDWANGQQWTSLQFQEHEPIFLHLPNNHTRICFFIHPRRKQSKHKS